MSIDANALLDQFVLEARECLEQIGKRLLEVERNPRDAALLNDLFRLVHTLKGNCGLFDFKPLERVVHAGEDLLDRVREGQLDYSESIADALLDAMDYTAELVDAIASTGQLPAAASERSLTLAEALRQHLSAGAGERVAAYDVTKAVPSKPGASAVALTTAPAWVKRVPEAWQAAGFTALRYEPERECFFKGEDPWRLATSTPGLKWLVVQAAQPWPDPHAFDCYRCNLELLMVSDAPLEAIEAHFRYVPEQISHHVLGVPSSAGPDVATEVRQQRLQAIWQDQLQLLSRPGLNEGTVQSVRLTLRHLLSCWDAEHARQEAAGEVAELPTAAGALASWAVQQPPALAQHGEAAEAESEWGRDSAAPRDAAVAAEARKASGQDEAGQKVLKISQDKLDRLMDLIGEMVVAKNALPYLADRAETVFLQRELAREIKTQYGIINRIAEDMQHAIMQVRMLPVGTVFQRFGRLVRDISKKLGKDVRLVVEGEDTEADKNVIESLADPLIHILRNSLDHGIELPDVRAAAGKTRHGTLKVAARHEGDRVILDITDDGAGIDTKRVRAKAVERGLIPVDRAETLSEHEAVQLVFLPGFSTADAISDLSGRGVGMDVVRSAIERVNGTVELRSVKGEGTHIRLALPLSMAVTNVMMIEAGGRHFGVPMDLIVETVRVPAEDIHHFKGAQTLVLRGRIVALRPLGELLALDEPARLNEDGEYAVLVVRHGNEIVGLVVDDFHGTSDIILKPLDGVLMGITGFAGTALMGDGSVLMILNPKELL